MASCKLKSLPLFIRLPYRNFTKVAYFSTKSAVADIQQFPHFRTRKNDPTLHSTDHIGKFYTIPPELKTKLFFSGGIPKLLNTQMKTFREASIMIREPAVEIISLIKNINYSNPTVRFVIYGRTGTGKTTTMIHLLHYAYESKFLLVHLPWVSNWTKRPKEVVISQYNEKRIDLPVESAIWLQHFKSQNAELMEELNLRTTKTYSWSKREETEQGAPLTDIIEHGIQRVRHSSDCVAVLLKELKHHSQFGKFKVFVLVDGVNAFWCKTNVKKPDRTKPPASEITTVHAFQKVLQNDWNNAVVVASVDLLPFDRHADMSHPFTPHAMLGKEGFELLDPFIPIETMHYNDKELNVMLDYYEDRLWIQSERARSEEGRKQLRFLSGYNPGELMALCAPL